MTRTDESRPEADVLEEDDQHDSASSDNGDGSSSERGDWDPWGTWSELQEAVGGIVDSALRGVAPVTGRFPRYDLIAMGEAGYTAFFDLPGLEKSDLELTVQDRSLTVSGERERPELPEGSEVQRSERTYGRFKRTVRIPDDADTGAIGAKMENGVLLVTLPLRAPEEAQTIDVE